MACGAVIMDQVCSAVCLFPASCFPQGPPHELQVDPHTGFVDDGAIRLHFNSHFGGVKYLKGADSKFECQSYLQMIAVAT